jgi:alcohol dehydrogenase class IV
MDLNRAATFGIPTKIIGAPGSSAQVGPEAASLGARRAWLVTDRAVREAGGTQAVEESLTTNGIEYALFDEVPPDPDIQTVDQVAELARPQPPDVVVTVGGGSAICVGKGVALLLTNPGSLRDYPGVGRHLRPPCPVIAVPTTAGSGSDVSAKFILTDEQEHWKRTWGGADCFPAVAVLDAKLLLSLPYRPAIYASLDAMSHAVEAYLAMGDTPLTDALALGAIEVLCQALIPAAATNELLPRQRALWASAMANIACGMAGLGLIHALTLWSSPVPHGLACALVMPHALAFTLPARPEKTAGLARALGGAGVEPVGQVVGLLTDLYRQAGVPTRMPEADLPSLEEMVDVTLENGQRLLAMNGRRASPDEVEALLGRAREGWRQAARRPPTQVERVGGNSDE